MEHHPDYADGLRDGQIQSLEKITAQHHDRLNDHSDRLRVLERIAWALLGIIGFIELWPKIAELLQ